MIFGIEYNTDHRHPDYRLKTFASESKALQWVKQGGNFAWPGAADSSLPPSQQNWHRRIRGAYQMPKGWRRPTREAWKKLPYWDERSYDHFVADHITKAGEILR